MPKGVYERVRSFDYAEAQRLHAEGMAVFWIAHRLGVSVHSVRRAIRPERQAYEAAYWRERRKKPYDGASPTIMESR